MKRFATLLAMLLVAGAMVAAPGSADARDRHDRDRFYFSFGSSGFSGGFSHGGSHYYGGGYSGGYGDHYYYSRPYSYCPPSRPYYYSPRPYYAPRPYYYHNNGGYSHHYNHHHGYRR